MTDSLFTPVPQQEGPILEGETTFEFLERGGRKDAIVICQWMKKWFCMFPIDHREELKRRLQSKDFSKFMGAYFELQVFAILRRLNCRVEIHPSFSVTDGTVDFRVTHGQDRFYVEATVCGVNKGILRSNTNEEDAIRKIRKAIKHPHSDVCLEAKGELRNTLGKQELADPIRNLLELYTPDDVKRLRYEHIRRRPRISIKKDKWRLDASLYPPIASNGKGQVCGLARGGPVDGISPVEKALSKKDKDWKDKGLEQEVFLIAINVCHSECFPGDVQTAICGHLYPIDQETFSDSLHRVSGVIAFDNARLGNELRAPVQLYGNPNRSIPKCLQFLRQKSSLGDLLGRE